MISSSWNVWFHSDVDNVRVNQCEEKLMNKCERCNTDLTKPEMDSWPVFSKISKYTQYDHLQTNVDIESLT